MTERFQSLEQATIFCIGRLEGLSGSTRFSNNELSSDVRGELKEIAVILAEAVKAND